ncbi:MAG TPA: hypothetical protein DIW44_13410 [Anaerolineaceae bacterium]|nr:hypothetical protein [Anaerolineaceae bacterium]
MKEQNLLLRPGTPDDDNRDYLPERIKGSDIVVNENGNNSQPYPERLKEFNEALTSDGMIDVWYEYVPSSYDPAKKTPLVVSMHGGLMTGWGQAIYTSWTIMAEKHGFIVAFPNASSKRIWSVEWGKWRMDDTKKENEEAPGELPETPADIKDNHDAQMALALIEKMKGKYNIDEERIFMQGMSMGDLMTSMFARSYGNILAGAAGSGCATFLSLLFDEQGRIKNKAGHLDIWQSRPELNNIPPDENDSLHVNKFNRYYWMRLNGCDAVPEISIVGEDNFAFYKGKKADLVYLDIKNRDHGQTLDDAALIWNYMFSGVRRKPDGTIVHTDSNIPRKGDKFAIAVAKDYDFAWLKNKVVPMRTKALFWQKLKYHGLNGGQEIRGEYLCVPLSFLSEAFGAKYEPGEDTLTVVVTLKDGRVLQFARGSIGCVIDNGLRSMYCEALHRDGELLVSIEWFCRYLFGLDVSCCDEVIYVTDHFSVLSANMADLIKDLLANGGKLPDYEKIPEIAR